MTSMQEVDTMKGHPMGDCSHKSVGKEVHLYVTCLGKGVATYFVSLKARGGQRTACSVPVLAEPRRKLRL